MVRCRSGAFLRVRIRLDIRQPLMRGVSVQGVDGAPDRWCPLVYGYLPDFCYVCGIIGHTEKACSIRLKEGEVPQFDKSLRYLPGRGRPDSDGQRRSEREKGGGGKSGLSWGRGSSGSGGKWGHDGSRSDGPTWRRGSNDGGLLTGRKVGEEDEVTSPLKNDGKEAVQEEGLDKGAKKALTFGGNPDADAVHKLGTKPGDTGVVVGADA